MIQVKICSLFPSSRYSIRRIVQSVWDELRAELLVEVEISELGDPALINKYASVLVLPTVVVNERVVCSGRVPHREEAHRWLKEGALIDAQNGA